MDTPTQLDISRFACTTMIVGRSASADGSVIVAHSDDDVADERVIYVPARPYGRDDRREVFYDNAALGPREVPGESLERLLKEIPRCDDPASDKRMYNSTELRRYIGYDRGPGYEPDPEEEFACSVPLGSIPQYPADDPDYPLPLPEGDAMRTFAYFDSNYGIMNERGLMIGECTCGAKVHPEPEPGRRIFYSAELSRVALERCAKAVDAIKLMGFLIKRHGYYGTGETLLVGDGEEAWVMEMCGYDACGGDGIWVAKRVPDDHYFVAANEFRIREVNPDADDMLYSDNLFEVCEAKGWWSPDQGPLDWLPAVSWGEYSNPYYSLRRVWRAMSRAAPSLGLSPWVEDGYTKAYPFSIVPDEKLAVADVARIYRDHYEGTEFDLTKGPAAGPFGNPTRYEKNPDQGDTFNLNVYHPSGAWERPLSIYRCGMMWINQVRPGLPEAVAGISWIGLDRPAANCLMPFYAGLGELPKKMETMILTDFDREGSAWWAFNFVANYVTLKYSYMMEDVRALQGELEGEARRRVAAFDERYVEASAREEEAGMIDRFCAEIVDEGVARWWRLSDKLVVKYNDGCLTEPAGAVMKQQGYPRVWLARVGYFDGPITYQKPRE